MTDTDKRVGILKEIDSLGRLVIPKEMREALGLEKGVELIMTEDGILLRSPQYKLVKKSESEINE